MRSWNWLGAIVCAALLFSAGCGGVSQIGDSSESMAAVDALWTAVMSKRTNLLEESATRIERLHGDGKMPDEVYQSLTGPIAQSRAGDWTAASQLLRKFIRGQRPAQKS